MRFSSLLPMLLLLASPLSAQLNCNIFDLTANVVQFDSTTCEFFVVLDFQHAGTSNQFHVKGNGIDYGLHEYNQVPVTIGPITANPLLPTTLEFLVQDAVFQDCSDVVTITVPPCNGLPNCDIFNLTVDVGDCGPNIGTYLVKIDFEVTNPGNGLFEVYTAGGVSLGLFPLVGLPLTLPNFPWGGGVHDLIKVCINDQQNCCETIEFLAPDCVTPGCGIQDLVVNTGDCLSDSTYTAKIGFNLNALSLTDSFQLYLDGTLQGVFGINQLPLPVVFETNGSATSIVEVCITLPTGLDCCLKKEFAIPACLSPCAIHDFKIETDSCTSDSTFGIWLNFTVTDSTAVDSFNLWGNGQSLGMYGMNQLPLNIPDFEWNGLIFNTVRVCTGNSPACCKELQFLAPDCLPFDTCEVTNIFVKTGPCTSDSTYTLTLNFNATNPGNGTFIVWANGVLLDTFDLTQVPLVIPDFPWGGGIEDHITVCIGGSGTVPGSTNLGCCKTIGFLAPDCLFPCSITGLKVEVGDCDPNTNSYPLTINFNALNPGNDFFDMYVNGQLYGTFPLNQLPLHIPNYPSSGNAVDVIKICINDHPDCCAVTEFQTPDCTQPCHIFDLAVQVSDCNPAGGFSVTINFGVTNPGNDFFELFINGQLFGIFPLNQLPLTIPNFPASGNAVDIIKICIKDHPDCCVTKEIHPPNCNDCEIVDLSVDTGDCNPDSVTYQLTLNFAVINTNATQFVVFGNGINLGTFNLNQLPLSIPNFPWDGMGPNDVLKVCIVGNTPGALTCCETIEFPIPTCLHTGPCEIFDLTVDTGDCNPDSTYHLTVNFQVANSMATQFVLFGNGINLGTFNLNQLPLTIPNFPWDGTGPNDVLKVCIGNINTLNSCCEVIEFPIPACFQAGLCDIFNMHVDTGNCTGDSTYQLTINFQVNNAPATLFGVWANGQFLGMYGLGQLPLTIQDFPWNGGNNDVVKVCFATNIGAVTCCETVEFAVPACLFNTDCEIFDLVVNPGDCTSDSTYNVLVNFQVNNALSNTFGVWANGQMIGTYNLNQLPLLLHDFPWSGNAKDVIKICFVSPNGVLGCCKAIEYVVPACLTNGGNCEIFGMVVDPGSCTSDSTYNLFLNFQVQNPMSNIFGVWANGVFQGTFNLNQLPLNFPNFPWDGGLHDEVKVCMVGNTGATTCCRTLEFNVPDCLGNTGNCHIFDVLAVRTGCLCGQFFVALTFNHENGGAGGYDVVGNGNNYGTFPYNHQQPIILGPFPGDGTTIYEFGVVDHLNSGCEDGFVLGQVECQSPVVEPGSPSSLVLSPNPATNWLNVTAMLENGTDIGQATVKIYAADGRLIKTQMISNAANFQLDISNIPAGVYRLSILGASGRLEGTFTKG